MWYCVCWTEEREREREIMPSIICISDPPDVSAFPESRTINQTDSADFTCQAFGIPVPSIQWFFNGSDTALNNSTSIRISDFVMTNGSGLDIRVSVIEIIDSVRSFHEGVFTCVATNNVNNSIGTPETDFTTLIVQGWLFIGLVTRKLHLIQPKSTF